MSLEMMMLGLLIVSTLTGLATEAVKNLLTEHKVNYHANTLAGVVSLVVSVAVGAGYVVTNGLSWNAQIIIYLIVLVFLSWLCAMVGYDKVVQSISQFKSE